MRTKPKVAIIDYGMGNLFNVLHACDYVGIDGFICSSKAELNKADAAILPGVGAFGDAMVNLKSRDLVNAIKEFALMSEKPFMGICLGLQLMMTESFEFGHHQGLNLIPGQVVRFESSDENPNFSMKVPHVGWNKIFEKRTPWKTSLLSGVTHGEFMYFVHSYFVKLQDPYCMLTYTNYCDIDFCSAIQLKNISAFQFHPERSGEEGLKIYKNFSNII